MDAHQGRRGEGERIVVPDLRLGSAGETMAQTSAE